MYVDYIIYDSMSKSGRTLGPLSTYTIQIIQPFLFVPVENFMKIKVLKNMNSQIVPIIIIWAQLEETVLCHCLVPQHLRIARKFGEFPVLRCAQCVKPTNHLIGRTAVHFLPPQLIK